MNNSDTKQAEQLRENAVMQSVLFEDNLVTYDTALLAKNKGFDIDCGWKLRKLDDGTFTHTNCSDLGVEQPTQSLLKKWLREKLFDITVITDWKKGKRIYYVGFSFVNTKNEIDIRFSKNEKENKIEYAKYEDALEVGLYECLQRVS